MPNATPRINRQGGVLDAHDEYPTATAIVGIATVTMRVPLVLARALHVDELRLPDACARDALAERRSLRSRELRHPHEPAGFRGGVECLDDSHVLKAFVASGLRLPIPQHAIREVQQLGRELIPLPDP